MEKKLELPASIASLLEGQNYQVNSIGMSGACVLTFGDRILKIEDHVPALDASIEVMKWLQDRIPAPRILAHEVCDGKSYLLMSRIPGKMCCDEYYLEHPGEMVPLLADGLRQLWATDPAGCPRGRTLTDDLARARRRIEQGETDGEVFQSEAAEFGTPENLLTWLEAHQPAYDPVLSHGDYCLPNILLENGAVSGFIDLIHAGVADRYNDIADCYWSLTHNFDGTFGGKVYEDFDPDILFEYLPFPVDREKLKYYQLLSVLLC